MKATTETVFLARAMRELPEDHHLVLEFACSMVFERKQKDWKYSFSHDHPLTYKILNIEEEMESQFAHLQEYNYTTEEREILEDIPHAIAVFPTTAGKQLTLCAIREFIHHVCFILGDPDEKKEATDLWVKYLRRNVAQLDFSDEDVKASLNKCAEQIKTCEGLFRLCREVPQVIQDAWIQQLDKNNNRGHFPVFPLDRAHQIDLIANRMQFARDNNQRGLSFVFPPAAMYNYTGPIHIPTCECMTCWTPEYKEFAEDIYKNDELTLEEKDKLVPDLMTNMETLMCKVK